ncbi:MAG: ATP/GTP-binding protein [Anaerolineae bacterium]
MKHNIRIAVTGSHGCGKTTFIDTISDPWQGSYFGASLVMDFGRITLDGDSNVLLFGTPRAQHFDSMLNILDQMMCVVMVDSVHPEKFREARAVLQAVNYFNIPYVVAANFQDCEDAWHPDDLRIVLRIPAEVPVVPCAAWYRPSVKDVLVTLFEISFAPVAAAAGG